MTPGEPMDFSRYATQRSDMAPGAAQLPDRPVTPSASRREPRRVQLGHEYLIRRLAIYLRRRVTWKEATR